MSLNGKVAVIAGAAGGLGSVVTQQMASQGTRLVLIGRSQGRLEALLNELGLPKEEHLLFTADLSQPDALAEIAKTAQEKFGHIDILFNLVGGWAGGKTLAEVQVETLEVMLQQHLWTSFYLTQAFGPYIEKSPSGRVIVVSSPTASQPGAKTGPYAIAKAAQEALMLTLAKELEGRGATANIIQVKAIDTKHRRKSDSSGKYADWTTPEEIAAAILFLCSDDAKMINGVRLAMNG